MARYVVRVATERSPEDTFAYIADLTNLAEWVPQVNGVEVIADSGLAPPREVDVTVKNLRFSLTLRYWIDQHEPPRRAVAKSESRLFRAVDVILVEPTDDGCVATYDAGVTLRGPLAPFGGMLQPVFNRIGDEAAEGLAAALDGTIITT